ncbi:metallophosphoesterase family protein [Kitasatospora mediocidica]|uniref:metallophosphoesterase family protein n=1 Tax=Kitasatospora mediocidica TaxID=58352 RepID=UPI00055BB3EB|nr:exonuclease SbcCD subunit D [Kitasatospora mediocidica]
MSRLLHTSDWHLGRTLYRHSLEEDFDAVLAEIADIARESEPDLIVHSGDLFDSRPTPREMLRAMRVLDELTAVAPTVVLAGNHDSPGCFEFLSYVSGPDRGRGLFFVERLRAPDDGGVLTFDACGGEQRIRLAVMPYVHPNRFWQPASVFGVTYADYAAAMRGVQAELTAGLREGYDRDRDVLVFAAHVFVAGSKPSYSERSVDIDAAYATAAADLPAVSYTALGHIHAPQAVAGAPGPARYAGSPLQLDFGEADEVKSVVIVDADPGRPVRVRTQRLTSGRRLAKFEGTLEELRAMAPQYEGAFLKAVIIDEEPNPQLAGRVAEIVPKAILINAVPAVVAAPGAVVDAGTEEEPDLPESLRAYMETRKDLGESTVKAAVAAFANLLAEVDHETPPPSPAEDMLQAALEHTWTEAP